MGNDFAAAAVNEITPANTRKAIYWLVTVTIVATSCMTSILINQAQYQKDQVILQGMVFEISETVSMMTQDHIRLDAEVKQDRATDDLVHDQLSARINNI